MARSLIIAALWVDTEDPTEATDQVSAALKPLKSGAGTVVGFKESGITAEFRRDLSRFDLAEVAHAYEDRESSSTSKAAA